MTYDGTLPIDPATAFRTGLRRAVRISGLQLLFWGALIIGLAPHLYAPHGVLLVVVCLASFLWVDSAMFVVHAVMLGWAALLFVLSGEIEAFVILIILAAFMVYTAAQTLRTYLRVRRAELDLPPAEGSDRARDLLPGLGCALSALAIVIVTVANYGLLDIKQSPASMQTVLGLDINLAALGIAFSLASLLSGFRRRALAILGLVMGGLVVALYAALYLL